MKVYWGTSEQRELLGECETQNQAFDVIDHHVRTKREISAPYYRFWNKDGQLVIDYGSYRNFYYVDFEEAVQ
ncbi:hypothetical protein [Streptococcus marmotae]|uniref:hypothetical protein n=1 Tax=Streptococcus marmotae TaxID=1825069 RepID=UPI00082B5F11|nr:hypothetical protein [Streptococcus marmotae]QBX16906.1 hypothetical protein Javan291_0030 [Streptococcus phage Javan291]